MGLNEVFKKVAVINEVTELASHQVELAIKDEITKTIANYESASKKLDVKLSAYYDIIFKAKKSFEELKADNNTLLAIVKQLLSEELKAKELGKELGIDVTGAPFYKDLQSALKRYEDIQSEFISASQLDKRIVI